MKITNALFPAPYLAGGLPAVAGVALASVLLQILQSKKPKTAVTCKPLMHAGKSAAQIRWFEPGEIGVTFESLFRVQLKGATEITVVDPHIKTFRQIHLFREFLEAISSDGSEEMSVHLITSTAVAHPEWVRGQAEALVGVQELVAARGVKLRVTFDESIHDRWISTERCTILLGKGIDIWEAQTCYSRSQAERPIAKKFAITYVPLATARAN